MRLPLKSIAIGVAGWLGLAAISAITVLPRLPATLNQWVALAVFGPPVYVVLEGLGERLFSPKSGEPIVAKPFSFRRVGITAGLLIASAVLVATTYAFYATM